jgi:nucleotide-binding universal stress UspA family protein
VPLFNERLSENFTMSYKTILVHVDSDKRGKQRIDFAAGLALSWGAHLVGLHLATPPRLPGYAQALAGPDFIDTVHQRQREQIGELAAVFNQSMRRHGLVGSEWRADIGDPEQLAAIHARYADLVIVGQNDPDEDKASGVAAAFAELLTLSCGRPVLTVPYAGQFESSFDHVLVCWKPSREATRAVTDAIPFLSRAKKVSILSVNPHWSSQGHGEVPGADLALYLSRHKVNATVITHGAVKIDVGDHILSTAADLGVDLIVMGAFGQSRLREIVFGGVTALVSQSMTVPVLFSH